MEIDNNIRCRTDLIFFQVWQVKLMHFISLLSWFYGSWQLCGLFLFSGRATKPFLSCIHSVAHLSSSSSSAAKLSFTASASKMDRCHQRKLPQQPVCGANSNFPKSLPLKHQVEHSLEYYSPLAGVCFCFCYLCVLFLGLSPLFNYRTIKFVCLYKDIKHRDFHICGSIIKTKRSDELEITE